MGFDYWVEGCWRDRNLKVGCATILTIMNLFVVEISFIQG